MIEIIKAHGTNPRLSVRNSYEAAGAGRRLGLWRPGRVGPNSAVFATLELLRDRSRDAVRNNAWISQGIRNYVSNEVGVGITPKAKSSNPAFNARLDELWEEWLEVCDADGCVNFYGQQAECTRARLEAGELFLRRRLRSPADGLTVPLQIELLEAEFCPLNENRRLQGGRRVRAGIEFNGIGRRLAYWMHRSHPGDPDTFDSLELVRVPAESVIHHFKPMRPGQIRGIPGTVQALIRSKIFDEYDDAELVRKRDKSAYTGAITQQPPSEEDWQFNPVTGEPLEKDANEVPQINVQGGTLFSLLPGEDIKMFDGDNTGGGYSDFVRQQLMGAAVGLEGVPYEFLSGDFSKVNDRIVRIILNEYRRLIEQNQWQLMIPQVCRVVRAWFVDAAVLAGAVDAPNFERLRADYLKTDWRPHRWPYIHPLQDVQAKRLEVRSGFNSRTGVAAEMGESAEEIDRQNAEDKNRAESLGLSYETDSSGPEDSPAEPGGEGAPPDDDIQRPDGGE